MARFNIDFRVRTDFRDAREANRELQRLNELIKQASSPSNKARVDASQLKEAKMYAEALNRAIEKTKNSGGSIKGNLAQELKNISMYASDAEKSVDGLNKKADGRNSGETFRSISRASRIATQDIKATDSQLDRLKRNIQEGVGQTIAFGAIGTIGASIGSAVTEVMKMDDVMTRLSIVSGDTRKEMEAFRDATFEAADALGASAREFLEASLIYKQQGGLAAKYAEELGRATVLGANIDDTGKNAEEISEYITAVMNGFDMLKDKGGDTGMYIMDVLSKLSASSGSSLGEISEGLQRVSNLGRLAGYEFEEISAAIATVSETTRRSASTIGNGFKSILVSFQQLREASDEEIEAFTSKIEETFKLSGLDHLSIFDNGELRDARDIMEDIGKEWGKMNAEQRAMVSEAIAGKYQAEIFQAFMENQERYNELVDEARNSEGIAAQQQMIYMDSIQAKVGQLKNSWQEVATTIISEEFLKDKIEQATNFLKVIGDSESAVEALVKAMGPLVGIFGQLFGGKFMAEASQRSSIKSLQDDIIKIVEGYDHISDSAKEAIIADQEVGKQQQKVLENLGGSAANAYRAAQEELARLDEKQREIMSRQKENIEEIFEKMESGGGYRTMDSAQYAKAAEEARKAAKQSYQEETKHLEGVYSSQAKLIEQLREQHKEIDKKVTKERTSLDIMNDYRAQLERGKLQASEMAKLESVGEEGSKRALEVRKRIEKALGDEKITRGELNSLIESELKELRKINEQVKETAKEAEKDYTNRMVQEAKLAEIRRQYAERDTSDSEELARIEQERALVEATGEAHTRAADKAGKMKKGVEAVSGAFTSLIPVISSYKSALDGAITQGEALQQSLMGIGAALLASRNPYLMATGGIALLTSQLADFRTEAQKIQAANEDLVRNFVSIKETAEGARSAVIEVKDEYEKFQGLDAANILNSGDTETIERYLGIVEKLAETSPELVKYYDAEGRAVIDLSNDYETLLKAKQEEVRLNNEMLAGGREGFLSQYSGDITDAQTKLTKASKGLVDAKKKLEKAQEVSDTTGVSNALAEIQKYNSEIQASQTQIKETGDAIKANVIQPLLDSNKAILNLSNSSEEGAKEAASKIKASVSEVLDRDIISSLLQGGDVEQVKNLTDGVEKLMSSVEGAPIEEARQFAEQLDKLSAPELMLSLLATSGEIEQMNEVLNGSVTAMDVYRNKSSEMFHEMKFGEQRTRESSRELERLERNVNIAGGTLGFMGGAITAASVALSPFTAGLSLAAGAALTAVGSVTSAATAANIFAGDIVEAKKAMVEGMKQTRSYYDSLNDLSSAFEMAAKTQEGYDWGRKEIERTTKSADLLQSALAKISSEQRIGEDMFATEEFQALKDAFPEIAQGYIDVANTSGDVVDIMAQDLNYLRDQQFAMLDGMMANNVEYFTAWVQNNADVVEFAAEAYGVDAKNFSTMAEYKAALQAISAAEFAFYEEQKALFAAEAAQNMADNAEGAAEFVGMTWGESVRVSLSNLNYLSSESMTLGQKVEMMFYMIIDAGRNLVTAAVAQIKRFFGSIAGFFADVVNFILGTDLTWGQDWGQNPVYSDYAGDFARATIAQNEMIKQQAIDEMTKFDFEAATMSGQVDKDTGLPNIAATRPTKESVTPKGPKSDPKDQEKNPKVDPKKNKKDKKEVKDVELEVDRYYKLDNILKLVEKNLARINRIKDEVYGPKRIVAMNQEQQQLTEQIKLHEKYLAGLQEEASFRRGLLENMGFRFNEIGEIENLNEKLLAMQKHVNSRTGKTKEEAIERFKVIQKEIGRYTDVRFKLIPDKQNAIDETKSLIKKLEKEKIEYKVQLKLDITEVATELRDAMKELGSEDYDKLDEGMLISSDQLKQDMDMVKYYQSMIEEVRKNTKLSEVDKNDLINEYTKALASAAVAAKGSYEELSKLHLDFLDKTMEATADISDKFTELHDRAGKFADMMERLYGAETYRDVMKLRDTQVKSLDEQIKHLKSIREQMIKYRDSIKEGTKEWEEADRRVRELGVQIEDSLIARVDLLNEKFDQFLEGIMKMTDKNIFGPLGLDEFNEQFEKLLDNNDKMLNTYEKVTRIGALIADVDMAIKEAQTPAEAEVYRKFKEEELETLLKSDKVSAKQLERAKMLWDIKQKEQALEERANAQRIAQLVRDENGNMTYEYVKQEEEPESKRDEIRELGDMKANLYDFDREQIKEANREIIAIVKETNDKIKAIYADQNLTEAEKKALAEEVYKEAQEKIMEVQEDIILWSGYALQDGIEELKHTFEQQKVSFELVGIDHETIQALFDAIEDGSLTINDILSGDLQAFAESIGMSTNEATKAVEALFGETLKESTYYSDEIIKRSNEWLEKTKDNLITIETEYHNTQNKVKETTKELQRETDTLTKEINTNAQAAQKHSGEVQRQTQSMIQAINKTRESRREYDLLRNSLIGGGAGGLLGAMVRVRNEANGNLSNALRHADNTAAALGDRSIITANQVSQLGPVMAYTGGQARGLGADTRNLSSNLGGLRNSAINAGNGLGSLQNNLARTRGEVDALSNAIRNMPGISVPSVPSVPRNPTPSITTGPVYGPQPYKGEPLKLPNAPKQSKPKSQPWAGLGPAQGANWVTQKAKGFSTGGYTGEWAGSSGDQEGRLAVLHEKEIVLNKEDTKNFLKGIELQRDMLKSIGGDFDALRSAPSPLGSSVEQDVVINANFPNVNSQLEIEKAFQSMSMQAQSYARRRD